VIGEAVEDLLGDAQQQEPVASFEGLDNTRGGKTDRHQREIPL
jgi:hypothetical protein